MNFQVVYCNHQTAKLDVRERLAFPAASLPRAYEQLRERFPDTEWVVIATCNRIEIYSAHEADARGPAVDEVAQFLSDFHSVPLSEFRDDLVVHNGFDCARHLFRVASSLDSMVLGEAQIVGQVKSAYAVSQENSAVGPLANALFQRSLRVAKRVRSETTLAEGRVSIASVAVGDFGKGIFDRFDDKVVLVIGAGEMATETLRYLQHEGAKRLLISNRSPERAEQLAKTIGGESRPFDQLDQWMAQADVIVSTTGAGAPLVDVARFKRVRAASGIKPVFILDLGAPRDFDPQIRDIDDSVFLYCIDDLEAICEQNRAQRAKEIDRAFLIVDKEVDDFMAEIHHRATGPIVKRLRETWKTIVDQETSRLFEKLPHLERDRKEIERAIELMVNKLLHPPLETLKHEAKVGPPHGLLDALKRLFRLHDSGS